MRQAVSALGRYDVLTIAKLSRWSINYYNDTARAASRPPLMPSARVAGWGSYYCEHERQTRVGLCAGDTHTAAKLVGFTDVPRGGGTADPAHVQLGKALPPSSALSPTSARVRVSLPSVTGR